MTTSRMGAYGPAQKARIEAGDQQALLRGLAATSALWFQLGGSAIALRPQIGCVHAAGGGAADAILAAACDLYDLLALSPHGRESLLHFCNQPVFEQAKGE